MCLPPLQYHLLGEITLTYTNTHTRTALLGQRSDKSLAVGTERGAWGSGGVALKAACLCQHQTPTCTDWAFPMRHKNHQQQFNRPPTQRFQENTQRLGVLRGAFRYRDTTPRTRGYVLCLLEMMGTWISRNQLFLFRMRHTLAQNAFS